MNEYKYPVIYEYISPYLVLLFILKKNYCPISHTQPYPSPYGLDLNVIKLLANLLTKPFVYNYLPIVILFQ